MTLDYQKHKPILLRILKEIFADSLVGPVIGFKGGTAAHLLYGLDRDSVDLDFDLLDISAEEVVFARIQEIVSGHGRIVDAHTKKHGLIVVLAYDVRSQNIKVEVSRRNIDAEYRHEVLLGIPMRVMSRADMAAHKIMAMHERIGKTSRDIYDVWFFLKEGWPINKEIIESRSGIVFADLLRATAEQVEAKDARRILDGLGELLTSGRKDWARAKLKEETAFLLRARAEG